MGLQDIFDVLPLRGSAPAQRRHIKMWRRQLGRAPR
jgi:hypothetical protein